MTTAQVWDVGADTTGVRFETENVQESAHGVMDRMMNPTDFMKMLKKEDKDRQDILITDIVDAGLNWDKESGHFYISPSPKLFPADSFMRSWFDEHKRMFLTQLGYETACDRIASSPEIMDKFEKPSRKFLDDMHDMYRGSVDRGLMFRTTSLGRGEKFRVVDAIVPGKMSTTSNYELLGSMLESIRGNYGDVVRGVQTLRTFNRANINYRVLFGNPVMREGSDPKKVSFVMMSFMGTDHGLVDTQVDLGLWRLVCTNGAMLRAMSMCHASWRRFDKENRFLGRIGELVSRASSFGSVISGRLNRLQDLKLNEHPVVLLHAMEEQRLISGRMAEVARKNAEHLDPKTNWDMFNILTDSAKAESRFVRRAHAESDALMLALQPDGFNGVVTSEIDRRRALGLLRNDVMKEIATRN